MSTNPWGLTPAQARAMDAICTHGCHKSAARSLGLALKTVQSHAGEARARMGLRTNLARYLAWDRWMRTRTSGQPPADARADFERWARDRGCPADVLALGNDYGGGTVAGMWAAWQAALGNARLSRDQQP